MHRRLTLLMAVAALVAAACGSSDDTPATGTTSTSVAAPSTSDGSGTNTTTSTVPAELTASWPGVTEDTIRLGFLYVDFPQLVEMGLVERAQGDPGVVIDALVDELNARGGVLGRQVEAFVEIYFPVSVVDAEAACIRLTEDNDVFAVLGAFVGPTASADTCFTDVGQTIKIGGTPAPRQLEQAGAPWLTTSVSTSRSIAAMVNLMHDDGLIVEPLAVVWAPEDQSGAQDVTLPLLEELGYDVAVQATQTSDVGDRAALDVEWGTLVERFRTDGIRTALLVGNSGALNGSNQLVRHGWDGETLVLSHGLLTSLGITAEVPLEDLAGITGSMGATAEEVYAQEVSQECVEILEAADPSIDVVPVAELADGDTDWASPLFAHCSTLRLFELVATAAGPDLTHETFVAGAESLGDIQLPLSPFASLGPGKPDASDSLRLAVFDPTLGRSGGASPVGELIDVPG